ncbi:hypothetical protein SLEP1_g17604 [Rubroshorea leprosula]|uniref:Secreted protein n=1 Tax=Rubroshorea leprosula TaxID=152421 RepID=A0AAV5IUT5_9ROSI|nr:hypothetical protein SLEP1_g17604 [Rubroshorea leprosula]
MFSTSLHLILLHSGPSSAISMCSIILSASFSTCSTCNCLHLAPSPACCTVSSTISRRLSVPPSPMGCTISYDEHAASPSNL